MIVPGNIFATGVFILVFSLIISSNADDTAKSCEEGGSLKKLELAEGCSISNDCKTVTCEMEFVDNEIIFKLEIERLSDGSATAKVILEVPSLDISWPHSFIKDGIIKVPKFTVSVPKVGSAGVYVQVWIHEKKDDTLHIKVNLLAGAEAFGKRFFPVNESLIHEDLPNGHPFIFAWWMVILIILGVLILLCCCIGCICKCRG